MDASCGSCGACGKAVRSDAVLYTPDARLVCPICYTKADVVAAQQRAMFEGWVGALIGTAASAVPLLVQAVAALMVASPGAGRAVVGWVELVSGVVAAACGGAAIVAARSR